MGAPHELRCSDSPTICWQVNSAPTPRPSRRPWSRCRRAGMRLALRPRQRRRSAELQHRGQHAADGPALRAFGSPTRLVSPARFRRCFSIELFLDAMYLRKQTADGNVQGGDAITDLRNCCTHRCLMWARHRWRRCTRSSAGMLYGRRHRLSKVHRVQLRSCHTRWPAHVSTEPPCAAVRCVTRRCSPSCCAIRYSDRTNRSSRTP